MTRIDKQSNEKVSENSDLWKILVREVKSLKGDPFLTNQKSIAKEVLHTTTSTLSRILSRQRNLTQEMARDWAEKLCENKSEQVDELTNELFEACTPPLFKAEIIQWFKPLTRGPQKKIMVVEFREPPALRQGGGNAHLIETVGDAVAKGLHYAMLLPFDPNKDLLDAVSDPIRTFLLRLRQDTLTTYHRILERAWTSVWEKNPNLETDELRQKLEEVSKRLRLYMLQLERLSACPGIGYRLFYIETLDSGRLDSGKDPQRWDWVSEVGEPDRMLRKEMGPEVLEITTIRYFPILEFWRDRGELPQSAEQILKFMEEGHMIAYAEERRIEKKSINWTVQNHDGKYLDEFIKRHPVSSAHREPRKV